MNRRKLLRKIIVNDEEYFWCVSDPNCDGDDGCLFRIWKNKVEIYSDVICSEIITPKVVREKILKFNK
jgi:hypothetical protein